MKTLDISKLIQNSLKPTCFLGSEIGAFRKKASKDTANICLIYPDLYEIGFSHVGIKLLYTILNKQDGIVCDRAYAPSIETKELMEKLSLPLFGLESKIALKDFDCIGFTLQTELIYSNILYCLDIAQIPLLASKRQEEDPIIIAGGPCAFNPLPLADFFDLFLIGDGEEAIIEIGEILKNKNLKREEKLDELAKVKGTYLPSKGEIPLKARKCQDLNKPKFQYNQQLMPLVNTVHNRYAALIMRGCLRSCRFCQAGYIYRPLREQNVDSIYENIVEQVKDCHWEESSLLSLSSGDYSQIKPLLTKLVPTLNKFHSKLSFPSLRLDSLDDDFISFLKNAGQKNLTIAPEAGSQRLRNIINKNISEDDIMKTIHIALKHNWQNIKLYFMIGLPFEQEEDIIAIPTLIDKIAQIARKKLQINITISPFIPKPFTPFQWCKCADTEYIKEKFFYIKNELKKYRFVKVNHLDFSSFLLEANLALGDKSVGKAILQAYQNGAKMDGWNEHLKYDIWEKYLPKNNLEEKPTDKDLPWDFIDCGIDKKFLLKEYEKAKEQETTPDCREENCTQCGACSDMVKNVYSKDFTAKIKVDFPQENQENYEENTQFRYRIYYQKMKNLKYLGHLDFIKLLYRMVLHGFLPIVFTNGFNKKPKLKFCQALPLGIDGENEFLDIFLNENLSEQKVFNSLKDNKFVPILKVEKIISPKEISIETYEIIDRQEISQNKIDAFLKSKEFICKNNKNKEIDLKKVVLNIKKKYFWNYS